MTLGEKIRTLRKEKDMSLEDLGKMTGVTRAYISQIERGDSGGRGVPPKVSLEKLVLIARALGTDLSALTSDIDNLEAATGRDTLLPLTEEDQAAVISSAKKAGPGCSLPEERSTVLGSMMLYLNTLDTAQIRKLRQIAELIFSDPQ